MKRCLTISILKKIKILLQFFWQNPNLTAHRTVPGTYLNFFTFFFEFRSSNLYVDEAGPNPENMLSNDRKAPVSGPVKKSHPVFVPHPNILAVQQFLKKSI
jgi:hypothetical protein